MTPAGAFLHGFITRFVEREGHRPSAVWYIVNQFAGRDPSVREPVLSSQPAELEEWARGSGGLEINAAELCQLVVAVEAGHLSPVEGRQRLAASCLLQLHRARSADRRSPRAGRFRR